MRNENRSTDFLSAQAYVGRVLPDDDYDCVDFFLEVQREIFNCSWPIPDALVKHKRGALGQISQFKQAKKSIFCKIDQPLHGCAVLIIKRDDRRDRWHIGTVFDSSGEYWVLHTSEVMLGASFNRLSDFARLGQVIEGYYKCK